MTDAYLEAGSGRMNKTNISCIPDICVRSVTLAIEQRMTIMIWMASVTRLDNARIRITSRAPSDCNTEAQFMQWNVEEYYAARWNLMSNIGRPIDTPGIYSIIRHTSVNVRKLQVAILARSPREMSQTDRYLPRYIMSRVRVSVRPIIGLYAKKPQTAVARPAAVDQRQELSAKTLLRSQAIRVQTPYREQYFFTFIVCD